MNKDYLDLNVRLMKTLDTLDEVIPQRDIDSWIRGQRRNLKEILQSEGLSNELLDILFYQEVMEKNEMDDDVIISLFYKVQEPASLKEYAKMNLDFYCIEYMLRRNDIPIINDYGTITRNDCMHAKDVKHLIYKSNYFRELSDITHKNYRKIMDEIMYRHFKPIAYEGVGINGVIAKTIVFNTLLEGIRVKVKAKNYGIQSKEIARDFYV